MDKDEATNKKPDVEEKPQRDEMLNPYWIEDPDLQDGKIERLPKSEISFFEQLIESYLKPLEKNKVQLMAKEALREELSTVNGYKVQNIDKELLEKNKVW